MITLPRFTVTLAADYTGLEQQITVPKKTPLLYNNLV